MMKKELSMAYEYITKYNSPNFTNVRIKPRYIVIHWWGDPAQKPTFEGVISTLCNPARQASAHYVAEAGRVACLVDPDLKSWATGPANLYTISIECNPRQSDGDYQTIGELVANIRKTYGNLPLRRHRDFMATACPGNYDLARIDRIAAGQGNSPSPSQPSPSQSSGGYADITALQRAVRVSPDNIWGRNTDKATYAVRMASNMFGNKMPYGVKFLQQVVGTVPDGILGRNTWNAHTETVKNIQRAVGVTPDGIYGVNTKNAVDALYARCHHIV
jgi:peptidoglycan hydrolase-like protein with peptidoglycan-binding domain